MNVSEHTIKQYCLKINGAIPEKQDTIEKVKAAIQKAVSLGNEVKLSPKEELKRLLNNYCKAARYVYHVGVLYVIVDDTVVTCYPKKKKELIFG